MEGSDTGFEPILDRPTTARVEERRDRPWCSRWFVGSLIAAVVMTGIAVGLALGLRHSSSKKSASRTPAEEACLVFCEGPLLNAVQTLALFNDSKTFVDMPMRADPQAILDAFSAAFGSDPDPASLNASALQAFVNEHFDAVGSDLLPVLLPDYDPFPAVVGRQTNATLANWTRALNDLWAQFAHVSNLSVSEHPARHSLLALPNPIVVPGGRFRESYYWDTYWITLGLLACNMSQTAMGVVNNLLWLVSEFGFVPNGGRVYYLGRSQPPLLSEMVGAVFAATQNLTFLTHALPRLETEYGFFMSHTTHGGHAVEFAVNASFTATLNRFVTALGRPRPESFREDVQTAASLGLAVSAATQLFDDLGAGAETGWDFSSRWFCGNQTQLTQICTSRRIPVDLNAILVRVERNLADWCALPGATCERPAAAYAEAAESRSAAMEALLWNEALGQWVDLDADISVVAADDTEATTTTDRLRVSRETPAEELTAASTSFSSSSSSSISASSSSLTSSSLSSASTRNVATSWTQLTAYVGGSNFLPLWAGAGGAWTNTSKAARALAALSLDPSSPWAVLQPGGVLSTTNQQTGQQWDAPNSWPPVNHLVVRGLQALGTQWGWPNATSLGASLARRWLRSNLIAFQNSTFMFEKYNAYQPGVGGGGGEYVPQRGFGWTNGVVLDLLNTMAFPNLEG